MFAARCLLPVPTPRTYKRRKVSRVCKSYFTIDDRNTTSLDQTRSDKLLHVITFHNKDDDGLYAVRKLNNDGIPENYIVAFVTFDDAFRFKTLLEAEMDYAPYIQFASHFELTHMCTIGGYKCRVVNEGILVTPPTETVKTTDWERRTALLNGRWSVRDKDDSPPEWP